MKIALNGATTMHADLATDIKAASAAGYDLLEIWSAKLYKFLESNRRVVEKLGRVGLRRPSEISREPS